MNTATDITGNAAHSLAVRCDRQWRASVLKISLVVAFLVGLALLGGQLAAWLGLADATYLAEAGLPFVLLVFVLAAAIPFVPGAEIGLVLLLLFGADIAFEVYVSMITALTLAYCIGRFVPPKLAHSFSDAVVSHLRPARTSDRDMGMCNVGPIVQNGLRMVADNRLISLALALNMPGNTILGGGGGLAMMAGASRLVSPLEFIVTIAIAIAVAPVPLCIVMLDWLGLALSAF